MPEITLDLPGEILDQLNAISKDRDGAIQEAVQDYFDFGKLEKETEFLRPTEDTISTQKGYDIIFVYVTEKTRFLVFLKFSIYQSQVILLIDSFCKRE